MAESTFLSSHPVPTEIDGSFPLIWIGTIALTTQEERQNERDVV